MDDDRFWRIIEKSRITSGNNPQAQIDELSRLLDSLTADEVAAFADVFDSHGDNAYRWDLWAAAYILQGGCSDDAFSDFRATLICRGRVIFERALENPDSLADLEMENAEFDLFVEGFQYVPSTVYERKTGSKLPPRKTPHPADPAGEPWNEESDELKKICPRLWSKYGWPAT